MRGRHRFDIHQVTAEEAINGRCPICEAAPGAPCTYRPPPPLPEHLQSAPGRLASYQRLLDRAGTPTKMPHHERRQVIRQARWAAERRARQAEMDRYQPSRPGPELLAAERAMRQYDRREYVTLAAWLRTWGKQLFDGL